MSTCAGRSRASRARCSRPSPPNGPSRSAPRSATPPRPSAPTCEPVENEDLVTFTATFDSGAVGTYSVSRVAHGLPNALGFEIFTEGGARPSTSTDPASSASPTSPRRAITNGYRQVLIGPDHPYIRRGIPMDFASVGYGQNELFAWQCRAFLDQVAGLGNLPPLPSLAHGLHNLEILAAIAQSALSGGSTATISTSGRGTIMKLGVYNAILHDRPLPEALAVIADLGLTGIEINSGGFLPPVHIPTFDDILVSDAARDDYLGHLRGHRRRRSPA